VLGLLAGGAAGVGGYAAFNGEIQSEIRRLDWLGCWVLV